MTLISGNSIELSFPGRKLFGGLNLEIKAGEIVSLLGPSGCGKSSLLRILMGLIPASQGKLQTKPNLNFSAVFQEPRLLPWRNLEKNLSLPAEIKGLAFDSKRSQALLQQVRLKPETSKLYPHELSGGMKMRGALARSLSLDPELLYLDEPFAALDENTRFELQELLIQVLGENRSALFVTHSQSEALFISDRILLLNSDGELQAEFKRPTGLSKNKDARSSQIYFDTLKELSASFQKAQNS